VILFFFIWLIALIIGDPFYTKTIYSLENGIPYNAVTLNEKPHDCEFLTAPLGAKHCHYEADIISSYKSRKSGEAITCSYDLGKTWVADCWGDSPSHLLLHWKRVDD